MIVSSTDVIPRRSSVVLSRRERRAAERTSPSRLAKSLLATVPIVLAATMTMTLATATPADAVPATRKAVKPVKPKSTLVAKLTGGVLARAQSTARAAKTPPSTYRVVAGDTVSSVAGRFGLSTASVLALNGLGWKSLIYPGQVIKLSKATASTSHDRDAVSKNAVTKYTITRGDTVASIAQRFNVSTSAVLRANGLNDTSIIFAGSHLTIPASTASSPTIDAVDASSVTKAPANSETTYTLATGDTISSVASKFGVSVAALLSANDLDGSSLVFAGREITIPTASVYIAGRGMVTVLDAAATRNARIIISTGRAMGVSDRGIVIALAAAMQESGLHNLDYGHLDSVGLFQQRPSMGWGTDAQLTDPGYASRLFFGGRQSPTHATVRGLLDIPGWQSMSVTEAAQAVQVSAHPGAYAQWETSARYWLDELG